MERKRILMAGALAVTGITGLLLWPLRQPATYNPVAAPLPAARADVVPAVAAATTTAGQPVAETRALPPIPEKLAAAIRREEDHGGESTPVITQADGSMKVAPPNGFRTTTVAVIGSDGKLVIRHGGDFLSSTIPDNNPETGTDENTTP